MFEDDSIVPVSPTLGPTNTGVCVLEGPDEASVQRIIDEDPCVAGGYATGEVPDQDPAVARTRAVIRTVVTLGALTLLTACSGSLPAGPTPLPSAPTSVRSIGTCPSGVDVPAASVQVVPKAGVPPTSVVRVGAAVAFTAHGRVGFTGFADPGEKATICRGGTTTGSRVVLVARTPGYVRIAVLPTNGTPVPLLLIKVTS